MRLLTAVSGVRVPQQAPFERNRKSGFFLFYSLSSNPLTLFSPCTTFACRSDGENSRYSVTSFLTGVRVLCEGVTPSRSHAFYYKNAPKAAGETAVFGAILYKCKGCGDDIPAGVQGRRPCSGQGAAPLGHSRAFSDMCGESAPAMTQRGERVSAERKECSGSPGENL